MRVAVSHLKVGSCIGEDVYTDDDMLIVAKHTIATENIIDRLQLFGIKDIELFDVEIENLSFTFDITQTQEFKAFKSDSIEVKDSLANSFNKLLIDKSDPEVINEVISISQRLFNNNRHNINVLDMLHNMQEFSDTTYLHCVNVGMIAALIGEWLGWPEEEIQMLVSCGLFHDIGKLAIPPEILNKPGKLTHDEMSVMKQHTVKGYKILNANTQLDDRIKIVALSHHERCDGSGYPFMIKKDKIDKYSKVIAIADVYDALTANRVYRGPMCPFDVIAIFEKEGFSMFETQYIMTFLHKVLYSYLNSKVRLSNGSIAEIVEINPSARSKPIVMMDGGRLVDLSQYTNIKIDSVL